MISIAITLENYTETLKYFIQYIGKHIIEGNLRNLLRKYASSPKLSIYNTYRYDKETQGL